jgi:hypothetical protein
MGIGCKMHICFRLDFNQLGMKILNSEIFLDTEPLSIEKSGKTLYQSSSLISHRGGDTMFITFMRYQKNFWKAILT